MEHNLRRYAITAIIVTASLLLLSYAVRRYSSRRNEKQGRTGEVNAAKLNPATDYDALALRMRNALFGVLDTASEKSEIMQIWLDTNNDEFTHLVNLYNERYASPPDTIRSDLGGEWAINPFKLRTFYQRMNSLNLA